MVSGRFRIKNEYIEKENCIEIKASNKDIYFVISKEHLKKAQQYTWWIGNNGYIVTDLWDGSNKKRLLLHRFLTDCPKDKHIDHIDHNILNNTIDNLQIVSRKQNMENHIGANKNSKSGVRGVYWEKHCSKWRVQIRHNNKTINGGLYSDLTQAGEKALQLRNEYFSNNIND